MSSSSEDRGRDLMTATPQQLAQLQTQISDEMSVLQSNFSSLRGAQAKFAASAAAVEAYAAEAAAAGGPRDALVPLTSSLYVPARLAADAELLVDIGTGFFVGKRAGEAREVLLKKASLLKANTDSLQKILQQKQANLDTVNEVLLQKKFLAQQQQQQQAAR